MKANYGPLYSEWKKIIDKSIEEGDLDEWRNIRAFYEYFKKQFMDGIKLNRELKRRKYDEEKSLKLRQD